MSNLPPVRTEGDPLSHTLHTIWKPEGYYRTEDPLERGTVLSVERSLTETFARDIPGLEGAPYMTVRWTCSDGDPTRGVALEIPLPDHRKAWLGFGCYLGKWLVSATIPTDQELETGLPELYGRLMEYDVYSFIGYFGIVANSMHREASPDPKTAKVWADRFTTEDKEQHGLAYYGEAGFDPTMSIEAMDKVRSALRSWRSLEHMVDQ